MLNRNTNKSKIIFKIANKSQSHNLNKNEILVNSQIKNSE